MLGTGHEVMNTKLKEIYNTFLESSFAVVQQSENWCKREARKSEQGVSLLSLSSGAPEEGKKRYEYLQRAMSQC